MSIRPVDFLAMVPKVNEQVRLQNEEQHRNVSQQQQQADNTARNAQTRTDTVHQQDGAQKAEIRDKESEKRRKRRDGKDAKENDIEDESALGTKKKIRQPAEGRTIDIRL